MQRGQQLELAPVLVSPLLIDDIVAEIVTHCCREFRDNPADLMEFLVETLMAVCHHWERTIQTRWLNRIYTCSYVDLSVDTFLWHWSRAPNLTHIEAAQKTAVSPYFVNALTRLTCLTSLELSQCVTEPLPAWMTRIERLTMRYASTSKKPVTSYDKAKFYGKLEPLFDVKYWVNLRSLKLYEVQLLGGASMFTALAQLQHLGLNSVRIKGRRLAALTQLTSLKLDDTWTTRGQYCNPFGLTQLQKLRLSYGTALYYDGLLSFSRLTDFAYHGDGKVMESGITLCNLTRLHMMVLPDMDVTPFGALTQLRVLKLRACNITVLSCALEAVPATAPLELLSCDVFKNVANPTVLLHKWSTLQTLCWQSSVYSDIAAAEDEVTGFIYLSQLNQLTALTKLELVGHVHVPLYDLQRLTQLRTLEMANRSRASGNMRQDQLCRALPRETCVVNGHTPSCLVLSNKARCLSSCPEHPLNMLLRDWSRCYLRWYRDQDELSFPSQ